MFHFPGSDVTWQPEISVGIVQPERQGEVIIVQMRHSHVHPC